ncbi:MAG TPA: biotin carboxylase N-terminal domain-containing protein [Acidimicrobiia bacterium]|nr:biotin carboxylase N-terminal domain-containing protein [Acidimicrobiia bacterium]
MISKILVANRGEIARRIFRTCTAMGVSTVAVYSEPDSGEPHVKEADQAILLPGSAPSETYLDIEALIRAAKESGADAVHPGYGFLAENPEFARAVIAAGLVWIGPPPAVIEMMGSKLESKRVMEEAGVPTLPSVELEGLQSINSAALSLGYPVLVKASAGGGGKGMRVVRDQEDLADAVESARREADGAFGDDTVFLEKYLSAPRHIEIQVFGDVAGNVVSLHERECSIQRRHQKIIEEAPSPAIDEDTRQAMSDAAVRAAEVVGYVGAGTVEFLYQDDRFWFLEMNTRLQVEHPVTELVTGLDLVRLQIEIANGELMPDKGPRIEGHAIEARLYAEDPTNDFLPVTGRFERFRFPEMEGLRVDSAVEDGSLVSVHYDPMIAKVIVHAPTRETAAATLATALRRAHIHGSTTNRALLVRILEHPEFLSGETDTHFLVRNDPAELGRPLLDAAEERLAALAAALSDQALQRETSKVLRTIPSGWRNISGQLHQRVYTGEHGTHQVGYTLSGPFPLEGVGTITVGETTPQVVTLNAGETEHVFEVARYGDLRYVDSKMGPARLVEVPRFPLREKDEETGSLHAPMPGRVVRLDASVGDQIEDGAILVVMEAMKMEHALRSPHAGVVTQVLCSPGDQVEAGAVLVVVEETQTTVL